MRRFSQRNSLVTLSDINITPLLDLAFVLLIIFVIMSPGIRSRHDHGMELKLPEGGGPERKVDVHDLRQVEISLQGEYMLDRRRMGFGKVAVERIVNELAAAKKTNPGLVVKIRIDQDSKAKFLYAVVDACQNHRPAITDFWFATEPNSR